MTSPPRSIISADPRIRSAQQLIEGLAAKEIAIATARPSGGEHGRPARRRGDPAPRWAHAPADDAPLRGLADRQSGERRPALPRVVATAGDDLAVGRLGRVAPARQHHPLAEIGRHDEEAEALQTIATHRIDDADLYFQYTRSEGWSLEEGIVKSGSFGIDQGVGVRAVAGEKTAFAYSDDISLDALAQAASATRAI